MPYCTDTHTLAEVPTLLGWGTARRIPPSKWAGRIGIQIPFLLLLQFVKRLSQWYSESLLLIGPVPRFCLFSF